MNKISRRSLARWAAAELTTGQSAKSVAKYLAAVMAQSSMAHQTDFLINDILWELESQHVLAVGQITSVHSLSAHLVRALTEQLKKTTNAQTVVIEMNIDKSVLGGLRVQTADKVWDETIARKLLLLKEVFNG